jgi:U3 small nucleolar RNA-associated protein 25
VHCSDARGQGDARFEYFTRQVLPEVRRLQQGHTLVFVPSYYDFVRLRNHAVREQLSHCCLSEYERVSEASRSRARFFHGQRDLMLYTGRAHFFKRYRVRGARHLVFYGLPEHPQFYPELVNLLEEAESGAEVTSCLVLFTRFEALALERVVGADRARHMLRSDKATFLFC